jgi:hypothetical protein
LPWEKRLVMLLLTERNRNDNYLAAL